MKKVSCNSSAYNCRLELPLLLALAFSPALAQTVVDSKKCEENSIHCPEDGEPSYKKYCCVENEGEEVLYSCCNPYLG